MIFFSGALSFVGKKLGDFFLGLLFSRLINFLGKEAGVTIVYLYSLSSVRTFLVVHSL